ncbi:MAG: peroxiredoxin family protein [Planctomycetota bacterium]|jgi:peroxiredoxin
MKPLDPREIGAWGIKERFLEQLANSKVIDATELKSPARLPPVDVLLESTSGRREGMRHRCKFERSKNCLPTVVEYLNAEGNVNVRVEIAYQEVIPKSAWFLREATTTYPVSQQTTTTRVRGPVRHRQDLPEDAFKVEFPGGTHIRDSASHLSYFAWGPEQPDTDTLIKARDKCPYFEFFTLDGRRLTLSQLRNKTVLVCFFDATDVLYLENMETLSQRVKDRGLVVLALGRGLTSDELTPISQTLELTFPLGADPLRVVYGQFARKGSPRTYLVRPDGIVAYQSRGQDRRLRQAARELAAARARRAPTASTWTRLATSWSPASPAPPTSPRRPGRSRPPTAAQATPSLYCCRPTSAGCCIQRTWAGRRTTSVGRPAWAPTAACT